MVLKLKIPIRFRLFLPVSFIIIIIVVIVIAWFTNSSIRTLNHQSKTNLMQTVETISKMFERESIIKLEKVQTNLKIARLFFDTNTLEIKENKFTTTIENQITGQKHNSTLNSWFLNGKELYNNNWFVDSMEKIIGGTITIFQKIDSGYVRITTNINKDSISRAIGTFIPNSSPVAKAISNRKHYSGRANILSDWYITAYEPIISKNQIVGMIYVGDKEKNLEDLKHILYNLKIGKSGYPFVFDQYGYLLIHPHSEGKLWNDSLIYKHIIKNKNGIQEYTYENHQKTIAFQYFEKFDFFVAAAIINDIENKDIIQNAIFVAIIVGIITILFLSGFIYYFTTERLHKYFTALQISKKKLIDAEFALKQSEKLANLGQISAGIAHEINNPLGIITMYSNLVLEDMDCNNPAKKDVELIVEQANRCKKIVSGLLNFARKSQIILKQINIEQFTKRSIESVIVPKNININIISNITAPDVMIDYDQMMQVFTNIEKNAIEAMENGGDLTIEIDENHDNIDIKFTDSGQGISEENLEKLFTPFFTTKDVGKGTGLGLPLVYGIVKMHKGKITVRSNADKSKGATGTTFIITIPKK